MIRLVANLLIDHLNVESIFSLARALDEDNLWSSDTLVFLYNKMGLQMKSKWSMSELSERMRVRCIECGSRTRSMAMRGDAVVRLCAVCGDAHLVSRKQIRKRKMCVSQRTLWKTLQVARRGRFGNGLLYWESDVIRFETKL